MEVCETCKLVYWRPVREDAPRSGIAWEPWRILLFLGASTFSGHKSWLNEVGHDFVSTRITMGSARSAQSDWLDRISWKEISGQPVKTDEPIVSCG